MAVLRDISATINGTNIYCKYFEADPQEITIKSISSGTLPNLGTNASFFGGTTMTAIHVVNGSAVRTGGTNNFADGSNPAATRMSCLYCNLIVAGSNVGYSLGLQNLAQTFSDVPKGDGSLWAIGGISLLLGESMSSLNGMVERYKTFYSAHMVNGGWIPYVNTRRARTFVGYSSSSHKVKFGVMTSSPMSSNIADDLTGNVGANYYDMYYMLKNNMACSFGLSIDGGGSSRIKTSATNQLSAASDPNRNPLCQLALS